MELFTFDRTVEVADSAQVIVVSVRESWLGERSNGKVPLKAILNQYPNFVGLIINLTECDILDSSAMNAIIRLQKSLSAENGKLVLHSMNQAMKDAFARTKLNRLLVIVENENAALAVFET